MRSARLVPLHGPPECVVGANEIRQGECIMKFGDLTAALATRRFWLRLIGCVVLAKRVDLGGRRVY